MQENEKTTVPIPSVGADGEQSLSYVTNEIITTGNEEINPIDESVEEMLRQMQRLSDPSYLATMTMSQLYDTVYELSLIHNSVPFAPVHLLFINLLTDSLPAIAIGMEPAEKDLLSEAPRNPKTGILTKDFMTTILTQGGIIAVCTLSLIHI